MASLNRVELIGRLTRDVELKYLQSGQAVAEIGMAVSDKYKNKAGEWVEDTMFCDVSLWGRTAEIAAEYTRKGSQVFIEGKLKLDTWEKDGQKRSKLKVNCDRFQMLDAKGGNVDEGGSQERPAPRQEQKTRNAPPPGDDIPFAWLVGFIAIGSQLPWLI